MIKLVINSESGSLSYNFNKKVLTLGSGSPSEIDVSLKEPGLLPVHLKITEEDGFFIVTNFANDPFITLSGIPFGKKILKNSDYLQVGKSIITFEFTPQTNTASFNDLHKSTDPQIATKNLDYEIFDVEKELNTLEQQADEAVLGKELDISVLMGEVKQFDEPDEIENPQSQIKTQSPPQKIIKSEPLRREKEPEEGREKLKKEKSIERKTTSPKVLSAKTNNWRLLLTITFSLITLIAACGAFVFINLTEQTNQEEILAAQGISDIAMALTYAQINQITPQMHNWSDPKFLKTNIASILPNNSSFLAKIDSHSHFTNCPYILRIYTNKDFSRFLVIALPAPSVLQWLVPKNAIIVDSQAMELRKIQDLRLLNRLLVNPNTLENHNGMEISALVKQGELLPLQLLAIKTKQPSFAPPEELAAIHPGAENYIYNAPRYYQLGESFAKRAINLTKATEEASHELKQLQDEVLEITKFPHLVIYSSASIESASQAKKALKTFVPQARLLNAFLISKEDKIIGSKLLLEDELLMPISSEIQPHSLHPELKLLTRTESLSSKPVNESHPLKFQLLALSNNRKKTLDNLANEMIGLLKKHTEEYDKDFSVKFTSLLKQYEILDQKEKDKIAEEIQNLYDTYATTPLVEVLPYTKAAGLEQIAQTSLKIKDSNHLHVEQLDYLLIGIQSSNNFTELGEAVSNAATFVRIKNIPETKTLILCQKRIRLEVTKKLDELLLSPTLPLSKEELSPDKKKYLVKILEQSWINDLDEQNYYLNEFDILSSEK